MSHGQVTGESRFFVNYPANALDFAFWFETNGASNPTKFAEVVKSVTRLTSTGGEEFYRVRICDPVEERKRISWVGGEVLQSVDDLDDYEFVAPQDITTPASPIPLQVPSAVAPLAALEFDVVVRDGATRAFTNQVDANRRVSVRIVFDKGLRLS